MASDHHPQRPASAQFEFSFTTPWGEDVASFFARQEQFFKAIVAAHQDRPILRLCYEDDIERDPRVAYEKVCEFLSLDPAPVTVNLKRTSAGAIKDLVNNYDALSTYLEKTPYEWMLHD